MNKNLLSMGNKIFYLLIFLIPSNLGKHFPQTWSYVNGILVDYLIPTLYVTDILIITILILWLFSHLQNNFKFLIFNFKSIFNNLIFNKFNNSIKISNFKFQISIILIILILVIYNLFFTKNPFAAIYKLLKLLEFGALIIYISRRAGSALGGKSISLILGLSVIWQSGLAIWQWFKQGSIFGYWFFGEQPFNTATHGIKLINWFGAMKAVPMGTFPHPNVLAGFLVISLIVIVHYLARGRVSNNALLERFILLISCILGAISLFLTFSFPSWFVFLGYLGCLSYLSFLWVKKTEKKVTGSLNYWFIVLLGYCIIGLLLIALAIKSIDPLSLSRRLQLSEIAFKMWLSSPIFGVGLNNFIPRMEEFGQVVSNIRFLQPVHNIYLLVLAETGAIGFIGLIGLIGYIIKKMMSVKNYSLLFTIYSLLFLGFFDHYFFTIQQGMLLLSIILGLSLRIRKSGIFTPR